MSAAFTPIKAADEYSSPRDFNIVYDETVDTPLADLLVGHKVTKVADDHLLIDDGTVLKFIGNVGGCSCGSGDYELTELNGTDNVITSVTFGGDEDCYQIFVFADNKKVNLATFEGHDGSGYYGTGYSILVRLPTKEDT